MATKTDSYAIISLGGKQYRVREGERLLVDRLPHDEGKTFHPDLVMLGGDGDPKLGDALKGAQVTAKVAAHVLGKKVIVGKHRRHRVSPPQRPPQPPVADRDPVDRQEGNALHDGEEDRRLDHEERRELAMAHKKGLGSSKNGRDSQSKRLGVKIFDGQDIKAGMIVVRQRGTRFRSGPGTGLGRDHTIFATRDGKVAFQTNGSGRVVTVV